MFSLVLF